MTVNHDVSGEVCFVSDEPANASITCRRILFSNFPEKKSIGQWLERQSAVELVVYNN